MLTRACGLAVLAVAGLLMTGCTRSKAEVSIEFTRVPPNSHGGSDKFDSLEGRVKGARPGQRIVLYARSGTWWIQPYAANPFTEIQPDGKWRASIHLGTEYAALLVEPGYVPQTNPKLLPSKGGAIGALAIANGTGVLTEPVARTKTLHFSGYEWEVRGWPSPRPR